SGFTDLLLTDWEGQPGQQKLDLLKRVKSSAVVMANLLEDTLTVSTLEAHGAQAAPSEVRVDLVVHEVLGMLSASLTSVDLAGLAPVTAWVDRSHVTQVVTNLLTNAIKYGSGVVSVTTEQLASGVRLRVSDHGAGVPPEFVAHLFDRFSRSTEARSGGQRGSGLGLYIVKLLLELNGGQVAYTDTPGGGATFTVSLASRTSVDEGAQPSSTASHPQPV
ncbi:MAG TPA: HAMP domain-containing sensor histidine kinase, partial [Nocardioidaceae bacterium]|nr:HAMP domain-containing sensor histidine kinase [Nocardioidaceae bacterium]